MSASLHQELLALIAIIPATIAAVAALRNGKRGKRIESEVKSPNGTSTAQAVQDIKHSVRDLHTIVEQHTERDDIVQRDIIARLSTIEGKVN